MKKSILFLCTGNSCRSQMAEGFARKYHGETYDIYSAGIKKHGMNPIAVQVMQEAGVDISGHSSKTLADISTVRFDYIFTVCSHADETCPVVAGARVIHKAFDDPPSLAKTIYEEDKVLAVYRRVRDEIDGFTSELETYL